MAAEVVVEMLEILIQTGKHDSQMRLLCGSFCVHSIVSCDEVVALVPSLPLPLFLDICQPP
jgi:hypothetical protein